MAKKIIVCCDGTWNRPGQLDRGAVTETNVQRIHSLIVSNEKQVVKYISGVGSGNTPLNKFFGGGFGSGLNKKIIEAYQVIVDHYEPEDEIFLFGFSRGAYTARSVGGFIRNCGILRTDVSETELGNAFRLYRNSNEDDNPMSEKMVEYREKYSHPSLNIKFIGVWDTVGALGIPSTSLNIFNDDILELSFHDLKLSSYVQNAFHALAIDERRKVFNPSLWQENRNAEKARLDKQRIEQVWFAGVHTNVGGGYKDDRLCNIPLLWMIDRAAECGLEFIPGDVKEKVVCHIDEQYTKEESYKGFYKLVSPTTRKIYARRDTYEKIHHSVVQRFNNEESKYQPENVLHALGLGIPIDKSESQFK